MQSELHHSSLVDSRLDAIRIARLRADGFIVVEITDTLIWTRPGQVVERLAAAVAQARALRAG